MKVLRLGRRYIVAEETGIGFRAPVGHGVDRRNNNLENNNNAPYIHELYYPV